MKLSPQNEAKLITAGVLTAIVIASVIAFTYPEFLYAILLGGSVIGAVRLIYEMVLSYINDRNTTKQLKEEFDVEKK